MSESPLMIAAIGPQRSGTSCIAGVLSHLGVPMGRSWQENKGNPKGYFEARGLRKIQVKSFYEIWDDRRKNSYEDRVRMLRKWAESRWSRDGKIVGGKNPHMCIMVPEMNDAWANWKAVATVRPAIESAKSMKRLPKVSIEDKERGIQKAIDQRDADLARLKVPTLYVPYKKIVSDPKGWVLKIIDFLEINPSTRRLQAAINHVDEKLNHYSKG